VFERITLGLYREPASAIRELISNAYDADATTVTIDMNAPLFDRIVVKDDGNGMSAEVVDYLVHHVGGSLKRTQQGVHAGVVAETGKSPGGRRLIGQMGIGLYSVARLTRHFTVATKRKGDMHRFVLDIELSGLDAAKLDEDEQPEKFVAGYAKLTREAIAPSQRKESGTTITLLDVLPEARRIMQSVDRWEAYYAQAERTTKGTLNYHIGRPKVGDHAPMPADVPWKPNQTPLQKFKTLVERLSTPDEASEKSPSIDQTLDYYLAMLWKISLSAPLRYVERHPYSLTRDDGIDFYSLEGDATPELVDLRPGESIGARMNVSEGGAPPIPLTLMVDGLELRRPVVFRPFEPGGRKLLLDRPKMFIGKFGSVREGADIVGNGYFFWSYDVIPKENNGMMARIAGASGTLFDKQFLDFRTSESVRLRQVSAEAFVERGLENALNIDRESFVETDPNVKALQRWAHRSMTRLFSRLKADQKLASAEKKRQTQADAAKAAEAAADEIWKRKRGSRRGSPPTVVVSSRRNAPGDAPSGSIFIGGIPSERKGGVEKELVFSARLRAVVKVLDGYGLFDDLTASERNALITDISLVIERH
jgi:hypothetical protein